MAQPQTPLISLSFALVHFHGSHRRTTPVWWLLRSSPHFTLLAASFRWSWSWSYTNLLLAPCNFQGPPESHLPILWGQMDCQIGQTSSRGSISPTIFGWRRERTKYSSNYSATIKTTIEVNSRIQWNDIPLPAKFWHESRPRAAHMLWSLWTPNWRGDGQQIVGPLCLIEGAWNRSALRIHFRRSSAVT